MSFTAKDVQRLRQDTGAGMMDAKRALEASDGDFEAAKQYLREKGVVKAAERSDRANTQGAVALFVDGSVGSIVQLKCETDFVAKSERFKNLASDLAALVTAKGLEAAADRAKEIEDLQLTLKEHIELGEVVRVEAAEGNILDSYLHVQGERGVNAVLVELAGGTPQLAHDIAVHIAFARPKYLRREDVPAEVVEKERATLEAITRNEGKPEQAIGKIVEGRLNGFFKEICLLEQPYAKDDKQSIGQLLGDATLVRFTQVEIG
jgi:elongation factor Ts